MLKSIKNFFTKRKSRRLFDEVIPIVLKNEGGYVDNEYDPGGETNFGISKRWNPEVDIKNLTEKKAIEIYWQKHWNPYRFHDIEDKSLRNKVFDLSIHLGPVTAVKLLQETLNDIIKFHVKKAPLKVDGRLGPNTLFFINDLDPKNLYTKYRIKVKLYYRSLVNKNPNLGRFLNGWINRLFHS